MERWRRSRMRPRGDCLTDDENIQAKLIKSSGEQKEHLAAGLRDALATKVAGTFVFFVTPCRNTKYFFFKVIRQAIKKGLPQA